MAVPKRKTSKSKRNQRRSHLALKKNTNIIEDKFSGEYRLTHHIDPKDGVYKGKRVISVKSKEK